MSYLMKFLKSESGAVTADWVVLTAAVVSLGLVVVVPIGTSAVSFGAEIANEVNETSLLQY